MSAKKRRLAGLFGIRQRPGELPAGLRENRLSRPITRLVLNCGGQAVEPASACPHCEKQLTKPAGPCPQRVEVPLGLDADELTAALAAKGWALAVGRTDVTAGPSAYVDARDRLVIPGNAVFDALCPGCKVALLTRMQADVAVDA